MFRFSSQRSYEFHHGESESFFQKARSESESAGPRKVKARGEIASGSTCEARAQGIRQTGTHPGRQEARRQTRSEGPC